MSLCGRSLLVVNLMHREALAALGRLVSVVVLCQLLCAVFLTRSIQFENSQVGWRQSLPGHLRDVLAIQQELDGQDLVFVRRMWWIRTMRHW